MIKECNESTLAADFTRGKDRNAKVALVGNFDHEIPQVLVTKQVANHGHKILALQSVKINAIGLWAFTPNDCHHMAIVD